MGLRKAQSARALMSANLGARRALVLVKRPALQVPRQAQHKNWQWDL
jgi:hypothetical protein